MRAWRHRTRRVSAATDNDGDRQGRPTAERRLTRRFYTAVTMADDLPTRLPGFPPPLTPPRVVSKTRLRHDGEGDTAFCWTARPCGRRRRRCWRCRPGRSRRPSPRRMGGRNGGSIDPATMPLTRLVNSGLDGVRGREAQVRADIVKYAASDLRCYRASQPAGPARRQAEMWDPMLGWAREALGAPLQGRPRGSCRWRNREPPRRRLPRRWRTTTRSRLAALHVMTTLTGAALLALAHARGTADGGAGLDGGARG